MLIFGSPARILVVDDDEVPRFTFSRVLRNAGYDVLQAINGAEALALAQEQPDLVLLDIDLPDVSGHEVCRLLKARAWTAGIPIVQMSAQFMGAEDRIQGLDGGADDYLVKPISSPELLARIRASLRVKQATERLARLQALTAALSRAATRQDVAQAIVAEGLPALGANSACVAVLNEEGTEFHMLHSVGLPQEFVDAFKTFPADSRTPLTDAVRDREPVILQTHGELMARYPQLGHVCVAGGNGAQIGMPMVVQDRAIGGIVWRFPTERTFSEQDVSFLLTVAGQCGQALERARLFDAEREARTEAESTAALLDTLMAEAPIGLAFVDSDFRFVRMNEALADIDGGIATECIGRRVQDVVPHLWSQLEPVYRSVLTTGQPAVSIDVSGQTAAAPGEERNWLANFYPVWVAGKAGVGVIVAEVTERKRAEEQVRRREEQLRMALDAARMVAWEWNPETDCIRNSPNAAVVLGLTEGQSVQTGQDFFALIHPDERPGFLALLQSTVETRNDYTIEFRLVRPDTGTTQWMEDRGRVIRDEHGRVVRVSGLTSDISVRKENEKLLQESEHLLELKVLERTAELRRTQQERDELLDQYRGLTECVPQLVWMTDAEGLPLFANHRCEEYFGRTAEQMTGQDWRWSVHPDDLHRTAEQFSHCLRTGMPYEIQNRLQRADGEYRWHMCRALPLRNERGEITKWFGTSTDIHEHKQTKEALKASEARFRAIVEKSYDAVSIIAADGTIRYASPPVVRVGGRSPEEVIGRSAFEWSHPDDVGSIASQFQDFVGQPGESITVQHRYRHEDGSWRWVEVTGTNFLHDPSIQGVVCHFHDITERKQFEEAQAHLAAIVQSTDDAIISVDLNETILTWNTGAERLFGYTAQEAVGRSILILVPPEDHEVIHANTRRASWGEHTPPFETTRLRKNGQPVDVSVTLSPLVQTKGRISGVCVIYRDVSERKRAEEALRKSEERYRQAVKMEAVGRLAGGVAHDFNNLLTIINGFSDLLADRLEDEDSRSLLAQVRMAGDRAVGLTSQMLAFGRKQLVQPQVLDLNALIARFEKMLSRIIGEDIELRTIFQPRNCPVKADPGQLEQVIMNLAVNARDAMPTGGTLTIRTDTVHLEHGYAADNSEIQPGHYVLLTVTDTGTGMDEHTQQHLFEPFFTTKEVGKGTGLGLATVYGIVKQSGGHIRVESEVDRGTTFSIYLPAIGDVSETREAGGNGPLPGGTETVLVAEDEAGVRAIARHMLLKLGYKVLVATNGSQALQVAQQHGGPINLLISDVVMPGLDGRELFEKLQEARPGLQVLYVSGYTDDAVIHHGISHAEVAFLQKPFTMPALAEKVREVLGTLARE